MLTRVRNATTISMTPPVLVGGTVGVGLFPEFFVRSGKVFRGNRLTNWRGLRGDGGAQKDSNFRDACTLANPASLHIRNPQPVTLNPAPLNKQFTIICELGMSRF
jgi:hypothetical protein